MVRGVFLVCLALGCVSCVIIDDVGNKFRFFAPDSCATTPSGNVSKCVSGITAQKDAESNAVVYELFTKKPSWDPFFIVAAFSNDIWMGDDSVFGCIYDSHSSIAVPELSYNVGHANSKLKNQSNVQLIEQTDQDGYFYCKIKITRGSTVDAQIFNPDKEYHILLAKGFAGLAGSANTSLEKYYHIFDDGDNFPFVTSGKHNVLKPASAKGDHGWASQISRKTQQTLVEVHGSIMLIGVWIFMSVGYLFSAFYKRLWDEKVQLGGKAAWFQIHRIFMSLALICLIVGFIVIFVCAGHLVGDLTVPGHETQLRRHAILGILAVILALSQPVIALLRCGKDDPYRPFFRYIHMFVAATVYGLTHACIFYAVAVNFTRHKTELISYQDDRTPYYTICAFLVTNAALIIGGWLITGVIEAKSHAVAPMVVPIDKVVENHEAIQHKHPVSTGWRGLLYGLTFIAIGVYIGLTATMINMIVNTNPNADD